MGKSKTKQREKPETSWFSKQTVVSFFGVSRQFFDREIRPFIPKNAIRHPASNKVEYFTPSVLKGYVAHKLDKAAVKRGPISEDDAILAAGGNSPALERFRKLKGDLAELDLAQKRGILVPIEDLRHDLRDLFDVLRRCGETLQNRHGNAVHEDFNRFLDEFINRCERKAALATGADSDAISEAAE